MKTMLVTNVVLLCLVMGVCSWAGAALTEVSVLPASPTIFDEIMIVAAGAESYGPVMVTGADVQLAAGTVGIDIFLGVGPYAVLTPWTHPTSIGALPAGLYELTVRTVYTGEPGQNGFYQGTFEVVPEPASVGLLILGGWLGRRFIRAR